MFKFENLGTDGGYKGYRTDEKGNQISVFHKNWEEKLTALDERIRKDDPRKYEMMGVITKVEGPSTVLIAILRGYQ